MKTIIVDDEPLQLQEFQYVAEELPGLEIIGCFDSPIDALDFAKENKTEMAFVDIKMPEMDGFALAKELRCLYPHIIIIALTASDRQGITDTALFDGIVWKPYEKRDLEKAIAALAHDEA